jgi:two-component system nitrate/nitrite response regulator NarL
VTAVTTQDAIPVRVLLIDDDPDFRELARRVLSTGGLDVVGEAGDAGAGTAAAVRLRPDAILVDVGLPDRDGFTLAGDLAALPWGPRVVLTSVDPDAITNEAAMRRGACGFIPKHDLPDTGVRLLLDGG